MSGLVAVLVALSGCSWKVELGYHGQTGRDDRVQTHLVRDGDAARLARDDKRY